MRILWFIMAIPYVPQILPGSDNQPTFTLIFLLGLFFAFVDRRFSDFRLVKHSTLVLLFFLIFSFVFSLVYTYFNSVDNIYFPRIFSFLQFLAAFYFGASSSFYLKESWLKQYLTIYFVFTLIYFLTGGLVEEVLIRSRSEDVSSLLRSTGRGVRTLSPEPAILAIHLFSMYLMNSIYYNSIKISNKVILLLLAPLISTLSGYGFFIALVILILNFPFFFFLTISFVFVVFGQFIMNFQLSGARIFLILDGLRRNGLDFLMMDSSFKSRYNSFMEYVESFESNFPLGDAFSIFSGGGFISIISGLGLVGLIFFILLILLIIFSKYNLKVKLLFSFWFLIYLFSGSFGVPLVGVIIGFFSANALKNV